MRFELHDTTGKVRNINADITIAEMRAYLGEFKTDCAASGKAYEYNHFMNWLSKYYKINISYEPLLPARVDM